MTIPLDVFRQGKSQLLFDDCPHILAAFHAIRKPKAEFIFPFYGCTSDHVQLFASRTFVGKPFAVTKVLVCSNRELIRSAIC